MVPERWSAIDITFCHCGPFFTLLNQSFEKMKKLPGDIIILQMCTINDNHMMYCSWDMKRDRQNFSSFSTIFCTFIILTIRKIKILKKLKHHLEILSLYTCVSYIKIIWCMVSEIWNKWETEFFVILDHFMPLLPR